MRDCMGCGKQPTLCNGPHEGYYYYYCTSCGEGSDAMKNVSKAQLAWSTMQMKWYDSGTIPTDHRLCLLVLDSSFCGKWFAEACIWYKGHWASSKTFAENIKEHKYKWRYIER